jgi:hypothetical protein
MAVLAALSVNLGKVCQKRGTQDLPLLHLKYSVSSHPLLPLHLPHMTTRSGRAIAWQSGR